MLGRRHLLQAMVGAALGSVLPAVASGQQASATAAPRRRIRWRNWSGIQECHPRQRVAPADIGELQELIRSSSGVIRPVGAGHSFTALVPTDETMVSLSRLSGLIEQDPDGLQARLWAGTRLGDIGAILEEQDQALINMPDIDEQSLAGALATATHGTGAEIGCLPTFVQGLQLLTAQGELLECDHRRNPELFQAARVSLGALGIITEVRLQNVKPYRLKRETIWTSFEDMVANAEQMATSNRNFEFYYIPFTGMGYTDVHNITDEPLGETEKIDPNEGVEELRTARDWLNWSPRLRELILGTYMRSLDTEVTVANSWKNYAQERNVRFNEMEYHLPRESALQAVVEVRQTIENNHPEVFFPIEFRYIKGDDIWLSPFHSRDCCSIAVHRVFDEDYQPLFRSIEPIFRKYGGRPHWGKLNTLQARDFAALYPRWRDFLELRQQLDPDGRFLNPYLRQVFGVGSKA